MQTRLFCQQNIIQGFELGNDPEKALFVNNAKAEHRKTTPHISQLKVEVSLRQPSLRNYYFYQIIKFKTFLDSIHGYINIRAMKDKSEQMNNWDSANGIKANNITTCF